MSNSVKNTQERPSSEIMPQLLKFIENSRRGVEDAAEQISSGKLMTLTEAQLYATLEGTLALLPKDIANAIRKFGAPEVNKDTAQKIGEG